MDYRDVLDGVFCSLSRRALRRRLILTCLCSASSSAIFRTMRVVLSICVSALGACALNTLVFVSFANFILLDKLRCVCLVGVIHTNARCLSVSWIPRRCGVAQFRSSLSPTSGAAMARISAL